MDILTKPLHDLTLGELAVILSRSDRPEDLAARLAREANIGRAQRIYQAALERAQRIQRARQPASDGGWSEKVAACTIIVQPVHPRDVLIAPYDLCDKLRELHRAGSEQLFDLSRPETIPDGLLFIDPYYFTSSQRQCQQLYSNGFLYGRHDVTYKAQGVTYLYLQHVAQRMGAVLAFARKYFALVSYAGDLTCLVTLDDLQDYAVAPLQVEAGIQDMRLMGDPKWGLLPAYRFEAALSGDDLRDAAGFQRFCYSFIEQVCWGAGVAPAPETVHAALTRAGLVASSP